MTIICYRDGVMAADGGGWTENDVLVSRDLRKILRAKDGSLAACSGVASIAAAFERFFTYSSDWKDREDGDVFHWMPPNTAPEDITVVIVAPDGRVSTLTGRGVLFSAAGRTFIAEGAGKELALGAMLHGATAEEAVHLCVEHHAFCAGTVQVEHLKPPEKDEDGNVLTAHIVHEGAGYAPPDVAKWSDLPSAYGDGAAPRDQTYLEKQGLR